MAKYYIVEQNGEFIFVDAVGKRVPEDELNKGFNTVTHDDELASSKVKTITQSGKYGYQTSDGQSLVDCVLDYDIKTAQGFVDAMSSLKTKYIKLIQQHPENKAQLRQALEQDVRSLHEARVKIVAYQRKLEKEATSNAVNAGTNNTSPTKNQSTQPTKTPLGNGITMLRDAQGHYGYEDNNGDTFIPCDLPIDVSTSSQTYNATLTKIFNEYKDKLASCPPSEKQTLLDEFKQMAERIKSARQAYLSKVQELDATNSTSTAPAEPTKAKPSTTNTTKEEPTKVNKEETKAETSETYVKMNNTDRINEIKTADGTIVKYHRIDHILTITNKDGEVKKYFAHWIPQDQVYIVDDNYNDYSSHPVLTEGIISKEGKVIVPCVPRTSITPMNRGYARISRGDKYGYISLKGEEILEPKYDYIDFFGSYNANITGIKLNDKWGIINRKGEFVVNCIYNSNELKLLSDDFIAIKKGGKWGVYNQEGKPVTEESIYDEVSKFHDGIVCVQKDGKYGFINGKGEEVVKCNFTEEEAKDILAKIENGTFNPENYKQEIKKVDDNENKDVAGHKKNAVADSEGVSGDDGGVTA